MCSVLYAFDIVCVRYGMHLTLFVFGIFGVGYCLFRVLFMLDVICVGYCCSDLTIMISIKVIMTIMILTRVTYDDDDDFI